MTTITTDQIEPFFFGLAAHQLFGCYHEPSAWPAREQGVVICYPYGQEYIRSHRACHQLAAQVARAGFPALRFDYFGTGDSCGEAEQAHLDQWHADLSLAVDELRARSGVSQVILAGLRLGASLALAAAPRTPDLAGLVLWEPVVDGSRYIAELMARHEEALLRFSARPKNHRAGARPAELLGFAVSEAQLTSIEAINLLQARPPVGRPVLLIERHAASEHAALAAHLQGGARVSHRHVPSFTVWTEDVDKGLVPQQVIEAIVAWLDQEFV